MIGGIFALNLIENINKGTYSFHVRRSIEYTEKHYDESLNLNIISQHLELNKCYFCDLFKKETGKNYSQFLNEVRIEKSKYLLLNTNLSILEIALTVGYNNQNYYNIAFKKITGITPLKYRNLAS